MIRIAKKCVNADGVKFDSITEMNFHLALTKMKVDFRFQVYYELVGPAVHRPTSQKSRLAMPLLRDRGIEAISMKVDFEFEYKNITYYCDTKGNKKRTERDSKMRYEMLKHKLYSAGAAGYSRVLFISTAEVKRLTQYAAYDKAGFWNVFLQIKER